MTYKYWSFALKFKHPFTTSKGSKTQQPTFIVELNHLGFKGYGEAPSIAYYDISVDKMILDLEEKKKPLNPSISQVRNGIGIIYIICFPKTLSWFVPWTWQVGIFLVK